MFNKLKNIFFFRLPIGTERLYASSPFIIGNFDHFLPPALWNEQEKSSIRFQVDKYCWTGRKWEYVEQLLLTIDELKSKTIYRSKA